MSSVTVPIIVTSGLGSQTYNVVFPTLNTTTTASQYAAALNNAVASTTIPGIGLSFASTIDNTVLATMTNQAPMVNVAATATLPASMGFNRTLNVTNVNVTDSAVSSVIGSTPVIDAPILPIATGVLPTSPRRWTTIIIIGIVIFFIVSFVGVLILYLAFGRSKKNANGSQDLASS